MSALEMGLAVATVLCSGGLAGFVSALSRRAVDLATAKKTDVQRMDLMLDAQQEEIGRLRDEVKDLRRDARTAAADAERVRHWAGLMRPWADRAVEQIRRLGGQIDAPPLLPSAPD